MVIDLRSNASFTSRSVSSRIACFDISRFLAFCTIGHIADRGPRQRACCVTIVHERVRNQPPSAAQPSPLSGRVRNGIVKRQQWRSTVALGTVKWFNSQKGYGFIQPQDGGKDVFVHISAVEKAGLNGLNEGQVVEYEEVPNKGKTSAGHLKLQR
jgi:CspA family cold shock protein